MAFGVEAPDPGRYRSAQDAGAAFHHHAVLPLDDARVLCKRPADLDVLAFDDSLRACHLAQHDRIVDRRVRPVGEEALGDQVPDAVSDHQVVLEAEKEPRLAWIALASGAAAE